MEANPMQRNTSIVAFNLPYKALSPLTPCLPHEHSLFLAIHLQK